MALPYDTHEGVVFEFEFRRKDFGASDKNKLVVVLVKEYSHDRSGARALVAPVEPGDKGYFVNTKELYTVPLEKLRDLDGVISLSPEEVTKARQEVKNRIPDY